MSKLQILFYVVVIIMTGFILFAPDSYSSDGTIETNYVSCQNCGSVEYKDSNTVTCPKCGYVISNRYTIVCKRCSQSNKTGSTFCINCGKRLE